jgi:hypothetical protein
VLVANNRELSVFSGNGDGTFKSAKQFAAGSDPAMVAVGSLNGDNVPDLVSVPSRGTTIVPLLNAGGTRVVVSGTPNPATYGQSISASATISATLPNSPTPTGTVTFKNGSVILGTVSVTNGKAVLNLAGLSKGSHVIAAYYSGSSTYNSNVGSFVEQIQ